MKSLLPLVIILLGCSQHLPLVHGDVAEAEPLHDERGEPVPPAEPEAEVTIDACEACLAAGGTWQPEIDECTQGCAVMDISCYTDTCPGECEDDCGFCFSPDACATAGCQWYQAGEAMWCGQW